MKLLLLGIFLLLCFPVVYSQSINDSVIMLPLKVAVPANAKKIGSIKEGNNGTAIHCDYEQMVMEAKKKARAMGGNIVKITKLAEPAFISKCYRINADVYHIDQLPANLIPKSNDHAVKEEKSDHAVLYIYRLKDTIALAQSYSIHINNDSVICTVKSKSRDSAYIYQQGPITLWGKTDKDNSLKLDIKFGHVYYVRCGLEKGEIKYLPKLELVDNAEGKREYNSLHKGKKSMSITYLQQIH